jgi:hypothetical protein
MKATFQLESLGEISCILDEIMGWYIIIKLYLQKFETRLLGRKDLDYTFEVHYPIEPLYRILYFNTLSSNNLQ